MEYPHTLTVYGAPTGAGGPGTTNPDSGVWTRDAPLVPANQPVKLYDGPADAQRTGEMRERDRSGLATDKNDTIVFLEDETVVPQLKPEQRAVIDMQDGSPVLDGRIRDVDRLSGAIVVRLG